MQARTPLSRNSKPFVPTMDKATYNGSPASPMVAWMPVFFASDVLAHVISGPDSTRTSESHAELDEKKPSRGRAARREVPARLPSRTPSPSGCSVCFSEASTSADSWLKQEESFADSSMSDVTDEVDDLCEVDEVPVKNTFVHFDKANTFAECHESSQDEHKKLSRSSSSPAIMLECPFSFSVPLTMAEKHELGKCAPCAYFHSKTDGCRLGESCEFCHFCPPTEVKTRKKQRRALGKAAKRAAQQAQLEELHQSILESGC